MQADSSDQRILRVLARLVPGQIIAVAQDERAQVNSLLRIRTTSGRYYAKVFRPNKPYTLLSPQHRAQAELSALEILARHDLLAPRVVAARRGELVLAEVRPLRAPHSDVRDMLLFADWLSRLHGLPVDPDWGAEGPVNLAIHAAQGQVKRLLRLPQDAPRARAARDILERIPSFRDSPRVMLHGDAALRNWGVSRGSAVGFDLEFSSIGAPTIDLGMLITSFLEHRRFTKPAFRDAALVVRQYLDGTPWSMTSDELAAGLLLKVAWGIIPSAQPRRWKELAAWSGALAEWAHQFV